MANLGDRGVALVLSGAGSRGAYQAGCWAALHEAGVKPALIVGTSAGALNGAMIAQGTSPRDMRAWWTRLRTRDLLRLRRDVWRWNRWSAFHDAGRLRRLLEKELDLDAVRRGVPLLVTATDVEAAREVVFTAAELTVDHLMATTALMPGLPPVKVAGRLHADGGHWNAFPVHVALAHGHSRIVALLHDPLAPHDEPAPDRLAGILRRMSDLTWHSQQAAAMERLALRQRLVPEDPDHLEPFTMQVHAPDPPLDNLILSFQPELAGRLYDDGYEQTRKRLA